MLVRACEMMSIPRPFGTDLQPQIVARSKTNPPKR